MHWYFHSLNLFFCLTTAASTPDNFNPTSVEHLRHNCIITFLCELIRFSFLTANASSYTFHCLSNDGACRRHFFIGFLSISFWQERAWIEIEFCTEGALVPSLCWIVLAVIPFLGKNSFSHCTVSLMSDRDSAFGEVPWTAAQCHLP